MIDSSASEQPVSAGESTAGERLGDILAASVGVLPPTTLADRIKYAESVMWKHWHEYCDWKRRLNLLQRQASDEFRAKIDSPAATLGEK